MKKFFLVLFIIIGYSCSPMLESTPGPDQTTKPVISTASLEFLGIYAGNAGIISPYCLANGPENTLYICDRGKHEVLWLDREGEILATWDGLFQRKVASPSAMEWDGIHLWVVDEAGSSLLRFDRNLRDGVTFYSGIADKEQLFGTFFGLAVERNTGDIYLTDRNSGSILRLDLNRGTIRTMGAFGEGRKSLEHPLGIAVTEKGGLVAADEKAGKVAVIGIFGGPIRYIGEDALTAPLDVEILPGNRIAVADLRGLRVLNFDGEILASAGYNAEDKRIAPVSIAYKDNKLFVSDSFSASILVYRID